jgi:Ca2+-binding EF-hand superfamily protein
MISGTSHIVASSTAIVLYNLFQATPTDLVFYGRIQAIAAAFHIATAFYQTPIVFGAKGIMHPSYYLMIATHGYYALHTFFDPGSYECILNTYMVLNIFTYCRIYHLVFFRNNYLPGVEYSISIFLAGLTIMPFIAGPAGVFVLICAISLNFELIRSWNGVSAFNPAFQKLLAESTRYTIVDPEEHMKFTGIADMSKLTAAQNKKAAKAVFDKIDQDQNGYIDLDEVVELTKNWNITPSVLSYLLSIMKKHDNKLYFDKFYRHIWHISSINKPIKPPSLAKTDKAKAKMVFDTIDIDGSGEIDALELAAVLVKWGCPDSEVSSYLKHFDTNNDGVFDFDEFFLHFQPIWRYGHSIFCHDETRAKLTSEAEALYHKKK